MSTSPPSTNGAASQIEWIRSPVAIDAFVARRTRAQCRGVLRRDRLLEPARVVGLEGGRDLGRGVR